MCNALRSAGTSFFVSSNFPVDNGQSMMHLRLARKDDREEAPLHFEGLDLISWAKYSGWIGGITAATAGIVTMVRFAGSGTDVIGALSASIGAFFLAAVIRCRRLEIIVGKRWLKWRCGPFKNDIPVNLIRGGSSRASTGWRRLYAEREITLDFGTGQEGPILPTTDPEELTRFFGPSS